MKAPTHNISFISGEKRFGLKPLNKRIPCSNGCEGAFHSKNDTTGGPFRDCIRHQVAKLESENEVFIAEIAGMRDKWTPPDEVAKLEAREASARAIMEKIVNKVDTGRARSTETYAEMKAWMEE